MILEEHTKDINSYIDTMNNIEMAIKIAKKTNDVDIMIKILNQFKIATNCLIELLKITEEERITA
mgnify:FL=1|tara:strand:- start:1379 stop:1573 length:195 start_codon:yes stop_codon:yes gene_type:complete